MPKHSFVAKTLSVAEADRGAALDRVLRTAHPGVSWQDVRRLVQTGKVRVDGALVTDPQARLEAGAIGFTCAATPER